MPTKLNDVITNGALIIAASCCLVVTIQVVRNRSVANQRTTVVREVSDWRTYGAGRNRVGPADAPVTIVEFTDFQCPACRAARGTIDQLAAKYPMQVQVVYRSFPLQGVHPLARLAAIAAECAAVQGRFKEFHDLVFAAQDTLDRVRFEQVARLGGIHDAGAFRACLASSAPVEAVDRDIAAGNAVGVRGTPTILVNSHLFTGAPPFNYLDSVVTESLLRAKNAAR